MAAQFAIHAIPRYWGDRYTRYVMAVFNSDALGSKWSNFSYKLARSNPEFLERVAADHGLSAEEKADIMAEARLEHLSPEDREAVEFVAQFDEDDPVFRLMDDGAQEAVEHQTDRFEVGRVSWFKAALTGDRDTYVPSAIEKIRELIGEDLPTLTPELKEKLIAAYSIPDETSIYKVSGNVDALAEWCDKHTGCRLFTVSW